MSNHTPGPWHVGKDTRVIGANSQRVCVCDDNELTPGFDNAKLIAAAPDLLYAMEQCLRYLADLNGGEWIKGYGLAEHDMRQRAKWLQVMASNAVGLMKKS